MKSSKRGSVLVGLWVALAWLPVQSSLGSIILAGDEDNFSNYNDPADALVFSPAFGVYLNQLYVNGPHNGIPMPFDMDTEAEAAARDPLYPHSYNWAFGYSFLGLGQPGTTLGPGAYLEIRLKASLLDPASSNDDLRLVFDESLPQDFEYVISPAFFGPWNPGSVEVLHIPLDDTPGTHQDFTGMINGLGHLDVFYQDDSAVDWIRLNVPEPASLTCLLLGAAVLSKTRRRRIHETCLR